jgi:Domain of unknown function (DUF4351)
MRVATGWPEEDDQRPQAVILRLLTRHFGDVPEHFRRRIKTLSLEKLDALGEVLLDFHTINDLGVWLLENTIPREDFDDSDYVDVGTSQLDEYVATAGHQDGDRQQAWALVLRLLTQRFGEVPTHLRNRIETLPLVQLDSLCRDLFDFQTVDDLVVWLEENWGEANFEFEEDNVWLDENEV